MIVRAPIVQRRRVYAPAAQKLVHVRHVAQDVVRVLRVVMLWNKMAIKKRNCCLDVVFAAPTTRLFDMVMDKMIELRRVVLTFLHVGHIIPECMQAIDISPRRPTHEAVL